MTAIIHEGSPSRVCASDSDVFIKASPRDVNSTYLCRCCLVCTHVSVTAACGVYLCSDLITPLTTNLACMLQRSWLLMQMRGRMILSVFSSSSQARVPFFSVCFHHVLSSRLQMFPFFFPSCHFQTNFYPVHLRVKRCSHQIRRCLRLPVTCPGNLAAARDITTTRLYMTQQVL